MKKVTDEKRLMTARPDIAALWHPTLNGEKKVSSIKSGSYAKIWWRCAKGHEWKAMVRTLEAGIGCPVCLEIGEFRPGKNDLETLCPEIASQWHPEKNGNRSPADMSVFSNYRAWWRCARGHEWQSIVEGRTKQNSGCGFCSGQHLIVGENDLKTRFPNLAEEWDYEANDRGPETYKPGSKAKVSWTCEKGHKWIAAIEKRTVRGQGCPYCSGRCAIPGENDIATLRPEVMCLWDYAKNEAEGIFPENIKLMSDKKVWCVCSKGHSWRQAAKKLSQGGKCPYCLNYSIIEGENDFATLAPAELLAEWNLTKNKRIKPTEIALHCPKKVWWCCSKGHEWRISPDARLRDGKVRSCPYCAGILSVKGETDLETMAPELMEDFDYTRNRKGPDEFHWGTAKKIWWKCHVCGHEWRCPIHARTKNGSRCPKCQGKG
jgi:hypothetical protein